jgi:hypothetical protein
MEDPEHAVNKWTRPYQWLRREAISNLRAKGHASTCEATHDAKGVNAMADGGARSSRAPMSPTWRYKAQTSSTNARGAKGAMLTAGREDPWRGWPDTTPRAT